MISSAGETTTAPPPDCDVSAAIDHRAAPVCFHLPGELPVHLDRELRGCLVTVFTAIAILSRSRANGRRSTMAFRFDISLYVEATATARDLDRRRPLDGFALVHISIICELHAGVAGKFATVPARHGSAPPRRRSYGARACWLMAALFPLVMIDLVADPLSVLSATDGFLRRNFLVTTGHISGVPINNLPRMVFRLQR